MTSPVLDLGQLSPAQGFVIQGDVAGDLAGRSVASAGDINGDGFADLIVGAPRGDNGGTIAGEAYVIFGKAGATRANIDLTSLAASDGFIIQGDAAGNQAGVSVSTAGDINGDGFADLIVGAPYGAYGTNKPGDAYVIFGKSGAARANIDLTTLAANDGFIIQGDAGYDGAGFSVSTAADINGDGFADLIVSAPFGDNGGGEAGEAYVIFGKAGATRANIDLTTFAASDGFIIQGDVGRDYAGWSVSSAGDINGDGVVDLIVGAPGGDNGGSNAGEAYVIFGKAGATRANIDLTTLAASDGFIIQGDVAADRAGYSVSSAGDINGDGIADLIVGAPFGDNGGSNAGEAYVVFGKAGSTRANIDLTTLAASDGFTIKGDIADDRAGWSVSSAGDINGDGFADLIVGAPTNRNGLGSGYGANGVNYAGHAYVIFGKVGGTRADIDLTSLAVSDGLIIQGDFSYDQAGFSVSSAGDTNGDGFDDLIVGAPFGDNGGNYAGEAYVIYGNADFGSALTAVDDSLRAVQDQTATYAAFQLLRNDTSGFPLTVSAVSNAVGGTVVLNADKTISFTPTAGFTGIAGFDYTATDGAQSDTGRVTITVTAPTAATTIDLTGLTADQGFIIQGDVAVDNAGTSVSSAGDINGDGYADMIVGASGGDNGGRNAGEAYVIFGKAGATRTNIDLTTFAASDGFIIQGDVARDYAGQSVSSAGDINGDGFADLIIGAPYGDNGGYNAGEAYVIFGKAGATRANIDLTNLTASDGFIIQGDVAGDDAGRSVSSAGDINGDGFADMIVGAPGGSNGGTYAGEAYVIFGKAGATRANIDLTTLAASDGFIIQGDVADDRAGRSVSSAGDINGDGFADLIVGASDGDNGGTFAGEAYVIFGKAGATRANIDLTNLTASDGFIIQGDVANDRAGWSVSSAGDINGDGFADLIVGARNGDNGGIDAGEAYVIFGKAGATRANIDLTSLTASDGFIIQGDAAYDQAGWSVSSAGDINGDGFDDLIVGAPNGNNGGSYAGEAYVIFGKAGATRANIDLTNLTANDGFIVQGNDANDQVGTSVSSAGDINGDGFADLIVGAPNGSNGGNYAGEAYVIYGRANIGRVNQAPTAAPVTLTAIAEDSGARLITAAELLVGVVDVDGPTLSITALSLTSGNGTLVNNGNATWSYTPATNDDTAAAFAYTVSDGSLSASSTASLDITPVNDAPVVTSPVSASVVENTTGTVYTVTGTDVDAGTILAYSISGTDAALFQINSVSGAVSFNVAPDFESPADSGANNSYSIVVSVSDGVLSADQAVEIAVTDVSEALNLTGSAGNDVLTGAAFNDTLSGLAGNDTLTGLGGDDTLNGGAGNDLLDGGTGNDTADYLGASAAVKVSLALTTAQVTGGAGTDTLVSIENLSGSALADTLTGNTLANRLTGLGGNDKLNGGAGADTMDGGLGNDGFTVDNAGDVVIEAVGQGTDTVTSSITYVLSENVENLTLSGSAAINGTGNTLNNTIKGNTGANQLFGGAGNDKLDGGIGADTLTGGSGNDTYTVDNVGDQVIEQAGEGTADLVSAKISFTLGDNFEKLTLTGSLAINGTGNAAANTLTGNSGANVLTGLGGNDTMSGGAGNDTLIGGNGADALTGGTGVDRFRFDVLETSANKDTIKDFVHLTDKIEIDRAAFAAFAGDPAGALSAANFVSGPATTSDHHLIYTQATGALFYDADGSGSGAAVQIALLSTKPVLDAADFLLI